MSGHLYPSFLPKLVAEWQWIFLASSAVPWVNLQPEVRWHLPLCQRKQGLALADLSSIISPMPALIIGACSRQRTESKALSATRGGTVAQGMIGQGSEVGGGSGHGKSPTSCASSARAAAQRAASPPPCASPWPPATSCEAFFHATARTRRVACSNGALVPYMVFPCVQRRQTTETRFSPCPINRVSFPSVPTW